MNKPIISPSQWVLNLAVGLLGIALTCLVFWFMYQSHAASKRGYNVSYWPPSITRNSELFPETVQGPTLEETADNVRKLVDESERIKQLEDNIRNKEDALNKTAEKVARLVNDNARLKEEMRSVEKIKDNFLYRITMFHSDALCYGNSLNFTYIPPVQGVTRCKPKEELARRFLGFLAEIDSYKGDIVESPKTAKDELTKYQESKSFRRTGWYSRGVLKWIVLDYLDKV